MMSLKKMITMTKTYSELISIESFEDRIRYLQTRNKVGYETFGYNRYLNQILYSDSYWKKIRQIIMLRDSDGDYVLDLGHCDHPIQGRVYIHHINPLSIDDVKNKRDCIFNAENLISVSFETHNLIHYSSDVPDMSMIIRRKNDTCPWR